MGNARYNPICVDEPAPAVGGNYWLVAMIGLAVSYGIAGFFKARRGDE